MIKVLENSIEQNSKRNALEKQNKEAQRKIDHYTQVVGLLEIRKTHFESLTKIKFLPIWLRAKYRLKALEIDSEMIAKNHFITIYHERLINVDYAENCLK
jgi:hypothetical protein